MAGEAAGLRDYPEAAAIYLPDGLPPIGPADGGLRLDLGRLADSLSRLADAGAADFYRGDRAQSLAADMKAAGSWLTAEDLAAYEALDVKPQAVTRGEVTYHLLSGLNAGNAVSVNSRRTCRFNSEASAVQGHIVCGLK